MSTKLWDDYVASDLSPALLARCSAQTGPALRSQRERIASLLESVRPRRVAVMGSGYLNDVPLDELLGVAEQLYLIDWVPKLSEEGTRAHIVSAVTGEEGNRCLACSQGHDAGLFCEAFVEPTIDGRCKNFVLHETSENGCSSYAPGIEPTFIVADVTAGRATRFARSVDSVLRRANSPIDALRKATTEAKRFASTIEPIEIDDHSIDFVTSSMVASQFDVEPWSFFRTALEARFGRQAMETAEERLIPAAEKLGTLLFESLVDGHLSEIHRLLRPGGRAYVSVEMFRSANGRESFFPVVSRLIDLASPYFTFDFEGVKLDQTFEEIEIGGGLSVVASFLLRPR